MAVIATYCQICSMPVQQDHYVPDGDMFGIYRADSHDSVTPLVPFGPEHAWLKDAVGIRLSPAQEPAVIEGVVHDGNFIGTGPLAGKLLQDGCVWVGFEDRIALHRVCWNLAGNPKLWNPDLQIPVPEFLLPYQSQLFEFAEFVKDGYSWYLVDPSQESVDGKKNQDRITTIIQKTLKT